MVEGEVLRVAGFQDGTLCYPEHLSPFSNSLRDHFIDNIYKQLIIGKCSSAPNQVRCTGSSRLTRGDAPKVRISTTPGR